MNKAAIRRPEATEKIRAWEKDAIASGKPLLELKVEHSFINGFYIRKMFLPKGVAVSSKLHVTEHPWTLSKGVIAVYDGDTDVPVILKAPCSGITMPGTKRIARALEDVEWTTFHINEDNTQDMDVIEARLIEPEQHLLKNKNINRISN
jgi:hypothetical protein